MHPIVTGLIYFENGGKKNPKLVFHGFDYRFKIKGCHKTVWICSIYNKTKCEARLQTTGNTVFVKGRHNHGPRDKDIAGLPSQKVLYRYQK